jgi:hypothetical protein
MLNQLVTFTVCLAAAAAYAAEPVKLDVYSVEQNTCGAWRLSATSPKARQAQYFWFLGFVSGNNFALPGSQVAARRMLNEAEFERHVTERCNASPKHTIATIAMEFVENNSPPANAVPSRK